MHDEDGFLAAIRQTPADDTARLVFADWLDEQDDPAGRAKAGFIRLELTVLAEPDDAPGRADALAHLRALAAERTHLWLAVVAHAKIESCQMGHTFTCPGHWDLLAPTAFDDIRRCGACKRAVRFCATVADANQRARSGNGVVVSPAVERLPNDLEPPQHIPLRPAWVRTLQPQARPRHRPKRKKGEHRPAERGDREGDE